MVLKGLRVVDVAKELGWGKDTLYRALRDERVLTDDEHARILEVIEEMA